MMARYVGFGGFPQIVDQKYKDAYKNYGDIPSGELPVQTQAALKKLKFGLKGFDIYREMRQYLTPEEFDAIRQAMINAFYTPIDVCRSMHNALKASGFNGGRMLETSAGVGNMVGTGNYDGVPHWTAIELDKTTGKITDDVQYMTADVEDNYIIAQANEPFTEDGHFKNERVTVRRRDDVNALAMLKAAYDGVILAGLLPDDDRSHLRTEGAEFFLDKKCPRVELIFTKEA